MAEAIRLCDGNPENPRFNSCGQHLNIYIIPVISCSVFHNVRSGALSKSKIVVMVRLADPW